MVSKVKNNYSFESEYVREENIWKHLKSIISLILDTLNINMKKYTEHTIKRLVKAFGDGEGYIVDSGDFDGGVQNE